MNNEIKYAITAAVFFAAWCLLEFATGIHNKHMGLAQYTEMIAGFIPWIFIVVAIYKRKNNLQQGQLTWAQAIRCGLPVALLSSIFISAFLWLYVTYINTGYNEAKLQFVTTEILKEFTDVKTANQQIDAYRQMYSGTLSAHLNLAVFFASMGIIVSAVAGMFLRSKKLTV
jgi:uncharacterized membrane protein YhdT